MSKTRPAPRRRSPISKTTRPTTEIPFALLAAAQCLEVLALRAVLAERTVGDFWKARAARLSRHVQTALACEALGAVTESELSVLVHYRRMDAGGRQAIRALCERLAQTPAPEGGAA